MTPPFHEGSDGTHPNYREAHTEMETWRQALAESIIKPDELGLAYESVLVPDARPLRSQVYEVSGQYYVPVLRDGDTVLTETPDILSYLETKNGQQAARSK